MKLREADFIFTLEGVSNKAEFSDDVCCFIKYSVRIIKYILEADWVKWYRRNFNLQIEVWPDDFREHFNCNILLLGLKIVCWVQLEGFKNMKRIKICMAELLSACLYFLITKTIQVFGVLSVGPSWGFCFKMVAWPQAVLPSTPTTS